MDMKDKIDEETKALDNDKLAELLQDVSMELVQEKRTSKDILADVINNTIEREYTRIAENPDETADKISGKNKKWISERDKLSDELEAIQKKMIEIVPDGYTDIIDELVNTCICYMAAESKILFKEGVILGATELNYLGEVGLKLNFI